MELTADQFMVGLFQPYERVQLRTDKGLEINDVAAKKRNAFGDILRGFGKNFTVYEVYPLLQLFEKRKNSVDERVNNMIKQNPGTFGKIFFTYRLLFVQLPENHFQRLQIMIENHQQIIFCQK